MKKISKRSFFLFSIFLPFIFFKPSWGESNKPTLLVVWKKKRVLALYRNNRVIKAYRVRLGFSPKGQKEKEGETGVKSKIVFRCILGLSKLTTSIGCYFSVSFNLNFRISRFYGPMDR